MKLKPCFLIITSLLSVYILTAQAQQDKKDTKALRTEINDKAIKDARKEAKILETAGWYTQPGAMPLEKQIERAWIKEVEIADNGSLKYFVGTGNSLAITQTDAKTQAKAIAKQHLAEQINSITDSLIITYISIDDARVIQPIVSSSTKEAISRNIARVITLTEIYKKEGENFECQIRIAFSQEFVKQIIKQSVEEKSNITHDKLAKLITF